MQAAIGRCRLHRHQSYRCFILACSSAVIPGILSCWVLAGRPPLEAQLDRRVVTATVRSRSVVFIVVRASSSGWLFAGRMPRSNQLSGSMRHDMGMRMMEAMGDVRISQEPSNNLLTDSRAQPIPLSALRIHERCTALPNDLLLGPCSRSGHSIALGCG